MRRFRDVRQLRHQVIDGVVDRKHARDLAACIDHGNAADAKLAHTVQCLADAIIFRRDQRLACHDVADRESVRVDVLREDLHHDVTIRDHACRRAVATRFVGDEQVTDLVFPHDLSGCGHVNAHIDGDDSASTN